MNRKHHFINDLLVTSGIDPIKIIKSIKGIPAFFHDWRAFNGRKRASSLPFPSGGLYPCLADRYEASGLANGHYFYQDLLIANRIFINDPRLHVDVGSRVDGFVSHVASFRKIQVIDIRPLPNSIPNVEFIQANMMDEINPSLVNYCDSLSCLHALEHFGMGRYGDPLNYDGYLLGLDNLTKILKAKGKLYLSVPIGPQRVEYNAHRVFSVRTMLNLVEDRFLLDNFSFVDDQGMLHTNADMSRLNIEQNFQCYYGCGIFELSKI